jgi:hypothetical protein
MTETLKRYDGTKNSLGYMCQEFKKDHGGKLHVAHFGSLDLMHDDETFKNVWPFRLDTLLRKHTVVSDFFALDDKDIDYKNVIKNAKEYFSEYSPDVVFILFSEVQQPDFIFEDFINSLIELENNFKDVKFYWTCSDNEQHNGTIDLDEEVKKYISENQNVLKQYVDTRFQEPKLGQIGFLINKHPHLTIKKENGDQGTVYQSFWANRFNTRYLEDLNKV